MAAGCIFILNTRQTERVRELTEADQDVRKRGRERMTDVK